MERWIRDLIDREKKRRGVPLEVKHTGSGFYLYQVTSVWDPGTKKRRKISKYIGRVNEDGEIIENRRTVHEYGNSRLLYTIAKELESPLRSCFPSHYRDIMAMGMLRNLGPVPIKLMKAKWEKLHASTEMDAHLSPNTVSSTLKIIGSDYDSQRRLFTKLLSGSRYLVFDLSSIFTRSENIRLAEKGHNPKHLHIRQINMAMLFSHERRMPAVLKPVPGSLRDPKVFRSLAKEYPLKKLIVIADRGSSPGTVRASGAGYIIPLKSNSTLIDYSLVVEKSFSFNGRGINASRKKTGEGFLYMFEDTMLRYEQESSFISRITEGREKQSHLMRRRGEFGKIPVLSNLDLDPEELYKMWKTREDVEEAFDIMKNDLEEDKTYLQDDDSVRGYFLTILVALYIRYRILNILKDRKVNGKLSVNEVLTELSRVYLITMGARRVLSEVTKKAGDIEKVMGMELFPKILRS
ncbi:MAG: transposase [Thermoplasmataceae archaeon]|jgi:transposase